MRTIPGCECLQGGWCSVHERYAPKAWLEHIREDGPRAAHLHAMLMSAPVKKVQASKRKSRPVRIKSDIGTQLLQLAEAEIGRISCGACRAAIKTLNRYEQHEIDIRQLGRPFRELAGRATSDQILHWFGLITGVQWSADQFNRRRQSKRRNAEPLPALPFTDTPRLTLLFHVWPNGQAWRRHIEKLQPVLHRFDRKILGIAHDGNTCTPEEVQEAFGDGWEHIRVQNRHLREVETYQHMLPMLNAGLNEVTFCGHAKGAQDHTAKSEAITWWTDAMYETVMYATDEVLRVMESGPMIVGSFRRHGTFLKTRYRYHFSGTFYAFRNAIALKHGVPALKRKWWGTESWPGDHFPIEWSHCLFGDRVGDMYKPENQPREELKSRRTKHGTVFA